MKGVIVKLVLLAAVVAGVIFLAQPISPCDQPLKYQLGQVDQRFNLTRDEAASDVAEAEKIWSQVYGKELFSEDPTAKLTVNFVFDERQALTNQITTLTNQVGTDRVTLDSKVAAFKAEVTDYQGKVADLNNQIDSWNRKGGAPPDIYQDLTNQQQALRTEASKLQQEANNLNLSARDFNLQVGQLNNTITTYNGVIAQKPEEGLYNGKDQTIAIYFANSRPELVHTLAHELGHALGMGHVSDKNSIMYPYTSEITSPSADDVNDLTQVCQKIPRYELAKERLLGIIQASPGGTN